MREIKISLDTATRWYNGTDEELKGLALTTYPELAKKELPKSWEELGVYKGWHADRQNAYQTAGELNDHKFIFATKEQAEASIALAQLSQLIEVYRNGWVPTKEETKYCINIIDGKLNEEYFNAFNYFLSFQDAETRDLFLENFRDLIEQAKPLMS